MAHGVRTGWLRDASLEPCIFDGLLEDRFMEVVSALFSCDLVGVMAGCREHPLPAPLFPCIWVFTLKRIGQSDSAQASLKISLMLSFYQIKVLGERFFDGCGKHRVAVLVSLAGPDYDLVSGEINILDPQPQAFHQSKACSIKQHGHEPIGPVKEAKNSPDLLPCQHDRQPVRPFRPDNAIHVTNVLLQNLTVEKQKGIEGLILGRGADVGIGRQTGKEPANLSFAHIRRVTLVMKENEPFGPMDIGFLCPIAVVARADCLANLVKQPKFW